ncbi:MAG: ABC transporter substrate-binding protein [Acidobacteriota bacterium]
MRCSGFNPALNRVNGQPQYSTSARVITAGDLEQRVSGATERWLGELLHHFAEGDVPERAAHYGQLQARRALENHCWDDAIEAAELALEFIDDVAEVEGALRLMLAEGLAGRGRPDGALREASKAVEAFQAQGQKVAAARAATTLVEVAWKYRRMEAVSRWLETGLALARSASDAETTATLLHLAATSANLRGESALARRHLEEARGLGEATAAAEESPLGDAGTVGIGLIGRLGSFDPAVAVSLQETEVLANIFEPLFEIGPGSRVLPRLARTLTSDETLRFLTVQLHSDRRFSDGSPLDAPAVKKSLEEAARLGVRRLRPLVHTLAGGIDFLAGDADGIAGIQVAAPLEVVFELVEPAPLVPAMLSALNTAIARRDRGQVLGTGFYRLARQTPTAWSLERNAHHPNGASEDGLQGPTRLDFLAKANSKDLAASLLAGEIDLARDLAVPEIDDFLARPSYHRSIHERASPNTAFLMLNRHGPAAKYPGLRRVLVGVLEAREMVWRSLGRFALPASSWVPPGILGHDTEAPGPRRLDRFEALGVLQDLDDPPTRIKVLAHPIFRERFHSVLETIVGEWAMLGLRAEIEELPLADHGHLRTAAADADVIFSRWYPDYPDPDAYLYGAFSRQDGLYGSIAGSEEVDALIQEARRSASDGGRERLYRRIQRLLVHEDMIVPLFHEVEFRVTAPSLGGLRLLRRPPFVDYRNLGRRQELRMPEKPRRHGRIRIPLVGTIDHLDPAVQANVVALEVMANVFETLTRIDQRGAVLPHLAESIESLEGGRVHRVVLRRVYFHDGRRLRAQDVRYTFQRVLRHGTPLLEKRLGLISGAAAYQSGASDDLTGMVVRSESSFDLHLDRPVEFFPLFLTDPALGVVPEGCVHFKGTWRDGCIGTGPFQVVSFEPGKRLQLKAHRDYWRPGRPKCEALSFETVTPGTDLVEELRQGRGHLTMDLRVHELDALAADRRFAGGVREHPAFSTFFLLFNRLQGPLTQPKLRRQLVRWVQVALPKAAESLGRLGVVASSLIPPGLLPPLAHRPSWSGGVPEPFDDLELEIVIHPLLTEQYRDFWLAFSTELQASGLRLKIQDGDLEHVADLVDRRSVDVVVGRWVGDAPDPSSFAGIVHSDDGIFGRLVCHERLDRLIERGLDAEAQRHTIYAELERVLADEALLWPLFHQQLCCVAHPSLRGVRLGYGWPTVRYDELSVGE